MAMEDDKFVGERKAEKVTVHLGKKGEVHDEQTRNRSPILMEIRLGLILIGILSDLFFSFVVPVRFRSI